MFVVGAGAGVPYGFPTGARLNAAIVGRANLWEGGAAAVGARIPHLCEAMGLDANKYRELRTMLQWASPRSIDALLDTRGDLLDTGKLAIAATLLPLERSTPNALFPSQGDWMGYLFDRAIGADLDRAAETVSFVTFNYDRLLEHRLTQYVAAVKGVGLERAWELAQRIEVVHVYGQLGPYSPVTEEGAVHWPTLDLGNDAASVVLASDERVRAAVEGISLVHERQDSTENVVRARRAVARASTLWFLGFGYDDTNLSRLSATLPTQTTGSPIYGSAFGMLPGETTNARNALTRHIDQQSGAIRAGRHQLVNADCLTALRTHANVL